MTTNETDFWDVSTYSSVQFEAMGDGTKLWIVDEFGEKWLFKENRESRSPDEGASEYAASRIAKVLGLPAAEVRLGILNGRSGALSKNLIRDPTHEFIEGSSLLPGFVDDFDPKARDSAGHSLENITSILRDIRPPQQVDSSLNAIDVFGLYLLFDALIGNTDRHSGNWAAEASLVESDRLLPSYDHATSLGITARHDYRDDLLSGKKSMDSFVRRAYAHRFENGRKTTLVEFAFQYCDKYSPQAPAYFRQMLSKLNGVELEHILRSSGMSESGFMLASNVVSLNTGRIIRCLHNLS